MGTGTQPEFILHRGCAYITYFLKFGQASSGLQGGGLVKVDLQTGEKEDIFRMEIPTDPFPYDLRGCGDYVYMNVLAGVNFKGTQRYNISTKEVGPLPVLDELGTNMMIDLPTEKYLFDNVMEGAYFPDQGVVYTGWEVIVRDLEGNLLEEKSFEVDPGETPNDKDYVEIFYDNDILFWVHNNRIFLYSVKEETWGQLLGETVYTEEREQHIGHRSIYENLNHIQICNGRIYRVIKPEEYNIPVQGENDSPYQVEYCEIADVLAGNAVWQHAFDYRYGE